MENFITSGPISIAILAGGHSKRMGQNKALLTVNNVPILQRMINAVKPFGSDIFLVTNTPQHYHQFQLPMVPDIIKGKAALGGIYTALTQAKEAWVLVLACDMPFVDGAIIQHLTSLINDQSEVVCPRNEAGYPEPLHSLYHTQCLPLVEQHVQTNELKIANLFTKLVVHYADYAQLALLAATPHFFLNVNTPADLDMAKSVIAK